MNLCDFEMYCSRKAEIRYIRQRLTSENFSVVDSVQGSKRDYPYIQRTVMISGQDVRRKERLRRRVQTLEMQCLAVEQWVQQQPDCRARVIISMRYLDGIGWRAIGQQLALSEDAVRKQAERYLQKNFF